MRWNVVRASAAGVAAAALLAFALPAQAALTDSQEQKLEELEAKLDDAALKEDQVFLNRVESFILEYPGLESQLTAHAKGLRPELGEEIEAIGDPGTSAAESRAAKSGQKKADKTSQKQQQDNKKHFILGAAGASYARVTSSESTCVSCLSEESLEGSGGGLELLAGFGGAFGLRLQASRFSTVTATVTNVSSTGSESQTEIDLDGPTIYSGHALLTTGLAEGGFTFYLGPGYYVESWPEGDHDPSGKYSGASGLVGLGWNVWRLHVGLDLTANFAGGYSDEDYLTDGLAYNSVGVAGSLGVGARF